MHNATNQSGGERINLVFITGNLACDKNLSYHGQTAPINFARLKTVVLVDKAFISMYLYAELYVWKLWKHSPFGHC